MIRITVYSTLAALLALTIALILNPDLTYMISKYWSKKSVAQRVEETKTLFDQHLKPRLIEAGLSATPQFVTLVFIKDEKALHLHAGDFADKMKWIKSYPVTAASGKPGPKLTEGDRQVPEGIYSVELLNPNSMFYLSLRVSYPNAFDRERGRVDRRENLGSDIMIHGSDVSIGCVAIGNEAIAEVFHLAGTTEFAKWKLIFAPTDLRTKKPPSEVLEKHPWMADVYSRIASEMKALQLR